MKNSKLKYLKLSLIVLVFLLCFTLFIYISNMKKTTSTYANVDITKKHSIDLTGDGLKETVEVIEKNNFYDVKITTKNSTFLLSSLIKDNKLCSSIDGNIIKLRFVNIMRDSKPELLVQGSKNNQTINYLVSYDVNSGFLLSLENNKNICGVIDSNQNKTPQFISLNYKDKKTDICSNMLINNKLINTTRDTLKIPGLDNVIQLVDYINLDVEIDNHPDIFTDSISSKNLSKLWKLDKNTFNYTLKNSFFFDSSLDKDGNIIECTYILSFDKFDKKKKKNSTLDVEVKLKKSYYEDLRISEMNFFI